MSHPVVLICTALAFLAALTGCTAVPESRVSVVPDDVMLGFFGPAALESAEHEDESAQEPAIVFQFGAGDTLGRSLFATYIAHLRSNSDDSTRFATVPTD